MDASASSEVTVAGQRRPPRDDDRGRLASVVGRTRARVLAVVREPHSTDEVAIAVGAANSSASEHLTALHRAGLVSRRRIGKHVYYELNDRGRSLLALLDDDG